MVRLDPHTVSKQRPCQRMLANHKTSNLLFYIYLRLRCQTESLEAKKEEKAELRNFSAEDKRRKQALDDRNLPVTQSTERFPFHVTILLFYSYKDNSPKKLSTMALNSSGFSMLTIWATPGTMTFFAPDTLFSILSTMSRMSGMSSSPTTARVGA